MDTREWLRGPFKNSETDPFIVLAWAGTVGMVVWFVAIVMREL